MKLSEALNEVTGTVGIMYNRSEEAKQVIQDAMDGKYDRDDTAKSAVPKKSKPE